MSRVERMNTWGKQRKQQSYVAQMNTQGFPCKDIWTLCQSLPWKRMYSSSICRCGGVCNPASLQRPCLCAPVAWAQHNKAKEANRASAVEIRTPQSAFCPRWDVCLRAGNFTPLLQKQHLQRRHNNYLHKMPWGLQLQAATLSNIVSVSIMAESACLENLG